MIDTVTIAGQPIDPCLVLAEVTVLHGRQGVADGPTASSATIVVEVADTDPLPAWQVPDTLVLSGPNGLMFTGRIASIDLEHPDPSVGRLLVTAAGAVARLGLRPAGDTPWPQEPGTTRAAHILTAAAVPYLIDGTADAPVTPRDVDSKDALSLLEDLAKSTSAAVVDLPDGRVVYQPMATRSQHVFPWRWQDFPATDTWSGFDPALTWGDMDGAGGWWSPASQWPVELPCGSVAWEPAWSQADADIVNHARIGYGTADPQTWAETVDQASIDRHERRYQYLGSQLALLADAAALASRLVTVHAEPHWGLPEVTVLLDAADPALRGQVLGLRCGDHVTVTGMPTPSPATAWTGIVEGWTYTQWAAGGAHHSQIVLAVSALPDSLAVARWADYPDTYLWADHPPWVRWSDLDALPPG